MKTVEQIKRKRAEIRKKALNFGKAKTLYNVFEMQVLMQQYEILGWVIEDET